jgi:succinyl-CoA synthetase beta subunit
MKIHEFQAKELLKRFKVPVPNGRVATTPEEAAAAFTELGAPLCAVKAQIHAGGRGKGKIMVDGQESGGGIRLAKSADEAKEHAAAMLERVLVTIQTGAEGRVVRRVLIEEGCDIRSELYVGMVIDRKLQRAVLMASAQGGMEIEEVAARDPGAILREAVDPAFGLQGFQARRLAFGIGLEGKVAMKAAAAMMALSSAFAHVDASLLEINPLVVTGDDSVLALDAKLNIDDSGLFKHPDIEELRDIHEEEPTELRAKKAGLSYVALDGNVGCLVNGAGLAMSTMDIIKHYGGEPANFLDVGGGADEAQVKEAFSIILQEPKVKAILVNIFGGIMRCDVIAKGVTGAARDLGMTVPLVVRLEGTEVEQGRRILGESGLKITTATTMADAAQKVVAAASGEWSPS